MEASSLYIEESIKKKKKKKNQKRLLQEIKESSGSLQLLKLIQEKQE